MSTPWKHDANLKPGNMQAMNVHPHISPRYITLSASKGVFLHSTISSPLDRSEHLTLHPVAALFIPVSRARSRSGPGVGVGQE